MEIKEDTANHNDCCDPSIPNMVNLCIPNQDDCHCHDSVVSAKTTGCSVEILSPCKMPESGGSSHQDVSNDSTLHGCPALAHANGNACVSTVPAAEPCNAFTERLSFTARKAAYYSRVRGENRSMPPLKLPCDQAKQAAWSWPAAMADFRSGIQNGSLPQKDHDASPVGELEPDAATEAEESTVTNGEASASTFQCSRRGSNSSKQKKKVVFADAAGLQLASVRLMTEGRDTPPRLDPRFLSALHQQIADEESPQFSPQFAQPMANYGTFMDRLARYSVCLESVAVITGQVTGTVKVRNIAFEKEVFVRFTLDGWATFEDVAAYYVNPSDGSGSGNVYDTFAFSLSLPSQLPDCGVQFAVCFRCRVGTFWDNNDSRNYSILWEPAHAVSDSAVRKTL